MTPLDPARLRKAFSQRGLDALKGAKVGPVAGIHLTSDELEAAIEYLQAGAVTDDLGEAATSCLAKLRAAMTEPGDR